MRDNVRHIDPHKGDGGRDNPQLNRPGDCLAWVVHLCSREIEHIPAVVRVEAVDITVELTCEGTCEHRMVNI